MKKLTFAVLCVVLCLAALATDPRPAAADCHEGCCEDMQRQVEYFCSYSYVRYFYCVEGYGGSCCAGSYECAPPWV